MPKKESAGILVYRWGAREPEVLLAHPGGPFYAKKDTGSWTLPKGEIQPEEDPLQAAIREFEEEVGFKPEGDFIALDPIRQKGGKQVHAWAVEGDCDVSHYPQSNLFELEWPPKSGRIQQFPELDRVAFFPLTTATDKIQASQRPLLDQLADRLGQGAQQTSEADPSASS